MQLPTGGITITRVYGTDTTKQPAERYVWYGGSVTWASFEFLPTVPIVGETIAIGPYHLKCIDRDDAAHVVALERIDSW